MNFSEEEQQKLLEFIKSHYVDYHDIRLLIANDMQKAIAGKMEANKNLTFEEALEEAYKAYGVIGFSDASEKYMKEINTFFYKQVILKILKKLGSTFRFWLLVILSFLIIHTLLTALIDSVFILVSSFLVLAIIILVLYFRKFHKAIKALKAKHNFYYVDQLIGSNNSVVFPLSYIPLMIAPHVDRVTQDEFWSLAIISILATISVIGFYLIYFKVFKNRENIIENYKNDFLNQRMNIKAKVA